MSCCVQKKGLTKHRSEPKIISDADDDWKFACVGVDLIPKKRLQSWKYKTNAKQNLRC